MCLTIATLFPRNFPFLSLSFSTPFLTSFFSHECFEQDGKTKEKKLPIHVFSFYFPLLALAAGERPYRHNKQALGTHLPPTTSRSGRNIGAPTSQPDIQRRPFPSTVYKRKRKAYRQDSLFLYLKPRREI